MLTSSALSSSSSIGCLASLVGGLVDDVTDAVPGFRCLRASGGKGAAPVRHGLTVDRSMSVAVDDDDK